MAGKLFKDWFNRRAEDSFTFNNEDRLFNWDEGRSRYSSYFISDNDSLDEAAKIVGSMYRVMNVPKNVNYSGSGTIIKNPDYIQLPLHMLREQSPNVDGVRDFVDINDAAVDAFYGACIQNAALKTMQTDSEYRDTLAGLNTKKANMNDLFFTVLNTERVEKKLSERFPGYLKLIQKYKDFRYDQNYTPVPEEAPEQIKLMDLIMRMLRYPAHITQEELDTYGDPLKKIERLIKKYGGMPKTSEECKNMSKSISAIIRNFDPTEPPPPPPPSGSGEEEGNPDDETETTPSSKKLSKEELDRVAKEMMKSMLSTEDLNKEGVNESMEQQDFDDFVDMLEAPDSIDIDYNDEGEVVTSKIEFVKEADNKTAYEQVLKNIDTTKAGVLRRLFARKNKDYDFAIRSMRTGRLDTNKIAEAKQGVPTIYERMGNIKTDKICVVVLIDESGSMNGGNKIAKAQQAAVFINEVFSGVPNVELFIYGHTADQGNADTNIHVYKEPGHTVNKYALGNVRARSNNRDGFAILGVAKRVRNFTKNNGIFIVISDGQPSACNYDGKRAIDDTRKKVTESQKLGFQVIQIAIEHSVPCEKMFDYFIKMTDIKNLPNDMITYLSRKVDRLVKERITL